MSVFHQLIFQSQHDLRYDFFEIYVILRGKNVFGCARMTNARLLLLLET
jgi:hypothetical protein